MKKTEFEEKGGITAEGMINALKRTGLCTWITGSSVNDSGRTVCCHLNGRGRRVRLEGGNKRRYVVGNGDAEREDRI